MSYPEDQPSNDEIGPMVRVTNGAASRAIDVAMIMAGKMRREVTQLSLGGAFDQYIYDDLHRRLRDIEEALHTALIATIDLERKSDDGPPPESIESSHE